jgi:hypothetical protein
VISAGYQNQDGESPSVSPACEQNPGAFFFFRMVTLACLHDVGAAAVTDDFLFVR